MIIGVKEMDSGNINKIWGQRIRILLNNTHEIDHLKLNKNTFCSTHNHSKKINLFYVLKGKVEIQTEFGNVILKKGESWYVRPPLKHRFRALTNAEMIEIAFVEKGKIDAKDINRELLGGRIIKGKYISIPELRKKGLLVL